MHLPNRLRLSIDATLVLNIAAVNTEAVPPPEASPAPPDSLAPPTSLPQSPAAEGASTAAFDLLLAINRAAWFPRSARLIISSIVSFEVQKMEGVLQLS